MIKHETKLDALFSYLTPVKSGEISLVLYLRADDSFFRRLGTKIVTCKVVFDDSFPHLVG